MSLFANTHVLADVKRMIRNWKVLFGFAQFRKDTLLYHLPISLKRFGPEQVGHDSSHAHLFLPNYRNDNLFGLVVRARNP